ncbi:hypothetical protein [Mucilaginibacter sp. L196]|uniref:hypothetical protein n=1 Tax=Mucilaginibacter sp. L196 TaxID=1641870 RepID=UPI00131B497F|nr:hypothetical protein [Mucilaginibacter sp. L196]
MNTYNENLQANVVTSLLTLQLEIKASQAKRDAAMFSLYYAEGAQITAGENLDKANTNYTFQQAIKEQGVNNNNIAANLLSSATQQKAYTLQSVTNTAVSASNIQIASNAIVRLAGDIGSIFSILKAADFDTEIYTQGQEANELMSKTAYDAEKASQSAMESSTITAVISASTVADEAKATNTAVGNLLSIISADYDAIAANVTSDNTALATASSAEKKAEGALEFINAEYFAANYAYVLNNKELNLDLSVPVIKLTADSYTVTFSDYRSAFRLDETNVRVKANALHDLELPSYPVAKYYVMLVKNSRKTVFSNANAEALLLDAAQYVEVPALSLGNRKATEILISQLLDSDGEPMELGQDYVVFVLTEFMDDYKKAINDFDNYLSAPSAPFRLTNQLTAPNKETIIVNKETNILSFEIDVKSEDNKHIKDGEKEDDDIDGPGVEYRCMFLPDNSDLLKGLLSAGDLRTIEKEVEKLEQIANTFDPQILALDAKISTLNATLHGYNQHLAELKKTKPRDKAVEDDIQYTTKKIDDTIKLIKKDKAALKAIHAQMRIAMRSIDPVKETIPGFFFNLTIAEQVPAANYTVAIEQEKSKEQKNKKKQHFEARIQDSSTDNFGNALIVGKKYLPVVLAVSKAMEDDLGEYTNALSGHGEHFIYVAADQKL